MIHETSEFTIISPIYSNIFKVNNSAMLKFKVIFDTLFKQISFCNILITVSKWKSTYIWTKYSFNLETRWIILNCVNRVIYYKSTMETWYNSLNLFANLIQLVGVLKFKSSQFISYIRLIIYTCNSEISVNPLDFCIQFLLSEMRVKLI
jgi:hypothetical protein